MSEPTSGMVSGSFAATGQSLSWGGTGIGTLSLSGFGVGTVSLDRSFDAGVTWVVVESFTADAEKNIENPSSDVEYRLNCSAYTSGTIVYKLGRAK